MKTIKIVGINLIITFILLEAGLAIAGRLNLIPMDLPSYDFANIQPFWRDINPDFGVWHTPNSRHRHVKECFDVDYRSNAHGMRDAERALKTEGSRVVVLGDSFVEGFGVERQNRFTNLLEQRTGVSHLNFGTSGNFGLTQSWQLYKTFASRFDHDAVIISILPDNDFADDDFSRAESAFYDRYRPYLVGQYPDYELKYYNTNRLAAHAKEFGQYIDFGFREFTHTAKAYSYFKHYLEYLNAQPVRAGATGRRISGSVNSAYFDFSEKEFKRMRYAIERISALAATKPVMLMVIPRRSDYRRAKIEGETAPITEKLSALSQDIGIQFVDLIEHSTSRSDLDTLFHECDGHWSAEGHRMATNVLTKWGYYGTAAPTKTAGSSADR